MDTSVSFIFTINNYVNVIFSTNGLEVLSLLRAHADLKSSITTAYQLNLYECNDLHRQFYNLLSLRTN